MCDLTNKIAIVTGASSGIGAGIVTELLQTGMKVVGLARRKAKVEKLSKGYEGKLFAVETDLSKEDDIINAMKWVEKNVGAVYVLVNNAGVSHFSVIDEIETEMIVQTLNTNILALTILTREAVRNMKANNIDGVIININSIAGHHIPAIPGLSIYNASKHAVTGFTESIRMELAKSKSKIRITSLSPGLVQSQMSKSVLNDNPYLTSKDIARGVKFILTQPIHVNVAEITLRPTGEVI